MNIYIADRRGGKTTRLLLWWLGDTKNRIIVCPNYRRVSSIRKRAQELAPNTDKMHLKANIIDVGLTRALLGRSGLEVGVDDADEILRMIVGHDVTQTTMTGSIWT